MGLIDISVCESDDGVYDAMNKAARLANGDYVCYMNAGDVYPEDDTLNRIVATLRKHNTDGLLGWGSLNDNIWASWTQGSAFKLSSLGFCHQSLYVKRELLLQVPFDDRRFKTDSDTLQLGALYEHGAKIEIVPEVWAVRGGDAGISADLERSKRSIKATFCLLYTSDAADE